MAATARQIPVTEADLSGDGGGSYAAIEVPGDYEALLKDVQDYDKTDQGKSRGWVFIYDVETPGGGSVEFKVFLSFGDNARWKLIDTLTAHGVDLTEGLNNVDPNALVGDVVGVHIDFPRDGDDQPTSKYREIKEIFPTEVEVPDGRSVIEKIAERGENAQEEDVVPFGEEAPQII